MFGCKYVLDGLVISTVFLYSVHFHIFYQIRSSKIVRHFGLTLSTFNCYFKLLRNFIGELPFFQLLERVVFHIVLLIDYLPVYTEVLAANLYNYLGVFPYCFL